MSQVVNRKEPTPPVLRPEDIPNDDPDAMPILKVPEHITAIWLAEDCALYSRFKRPNLWRRFWTWAFFGWKWERLDRDAE